MKRNIDRVTDLFLGIIVIIFLMVMFYLTQQNYQLLKQSNAAVIQTGNIIREEQNISADFKNAIIYISTLKDSNPKEYADTYGTGLWQISIDLQHLKSIVSRSDQLKLDSLSREIDSQVSWMMSKKATDPQFESERNEHIKGLSVILAFFDNEISALEKSSVIDIKNSENSLVRLHNWIIVLIVTSSLIIAIMLVLISMQFRKVKMQNTRLMEIAWIQSHKVRSHVATLLGLSQLFNHDNPTDHENGKIVTNMVATTNRLDEIVKEINDKTSG